MAFELRLRGKSTSHERVWGSPVTECGRSYVGSAISQDVFEGLFFLEFCGSIWTVRDLWAWFPMKILLWHPHHVHITLLSTPMSTFLPGIGPSTPTQLHLLWLHLLPPRISKQPPEDTADTSWLFCSVSDSCSLYCGLDVFLPRPSEPVHCPHSWNAYSVLPVDVTPQVTKSFWCFGIARSSQLGFAFGEHLVVWIGSILESARKVRSLKSMNDAHLPLKDITVVGLIGF